MNVPGLQSDVFFGSVDSPLPDWRVETQDTDDPEAADVPDSNRRELVAVLGFDPLAGEETESTPAVAADRQDIN